MPSVAEARPVSKRSGPACAAADPELFFPDQDSATLPHVRAAKAVCGRCDLAEACLRWALETDERYGIWGGQTARERTALQKKIAATAEVAA